MSEKRKPSKLQVNPQDVLESLMGCPIEVFVSSQTEEHENRIMRGALRGFSDGWIVVQEVVNSKGEPAENEDLTLIAINAIQILKKA